MTSHHRVLETRHELDRGVALDRSQLLRELLLCELEYRRRSGEHPTQDEYEHRFPDLSEVLSDVFYRSEVLPEAARTVPTAGKKDQEFSTGHESPGQERQREARRRQGRPKTIGRYSVKKLLGEGGFGSVYLAYDGTLQREVEFYRILDGFIKNIPDATCPAIPQEPIGPKQIGQGHGAYRQEIHLTGSL